MKLMKTVVILFLLMTVRPVWAGQIHNAVEEGNLAKIRSILKQNPALVNSRNQARETPLHIAAKNGDFQIARYLVRMGADPSLKDSYNDTPLFNAKVNGYKDLAGIMISSGPEIHQAVVKGNVGSLRSSLKRNPSSVSSVDTDRDTPLHWAAIWNKRDAAMFLIKKGAKVNVRDYKGLTPTHWASGKGNLELVALLAANGADLNRSDLLGRTPLHLAAYRGKENTANYLIKKGADVNARDRKGETPLHLAVHSDRDVVALLLARGADVNARDRHGHTPLFYAYSMAAIGGQKENDIVRLLLRYGADPGVKNEKGITPGDLFKHLEIN